MEPQTIAAMHTSLNNAIVPSPLISQKIFFVRGTRVMLDADLAQLYGVATKNLNKAVKRNASRFPSDFMFRLSSKDIRNLRFQIGTSRGAHGGRRYAPYAFTEQGIAMLSSVLRSSRAVQVNVAIMRTFVRIREMLAKYYAPQPAVVVQPKKRAVSRKPASRKPASRKSPARSNRKGVKVHG